MTLNFHRVYKELRALAPVWGLGALTILGFAFACTLEMEFERRAYLCSGVFVVYAAISFALGAMCFGSEFDHGTLQRLLSEPVSRWQLWREKNLALLLCLVALYLVVCLGFFILGDSMGENFSVGGVVYFCSLVVVYAGVGGPLCALLLRQTHLAVWVSMGLPIFLLAVPLLVDSILEWSNSFSVIDALRMDEDEFVPMLTLPWYAIGYFFTRKTFVRMEIVPKGYRREVFALKQGVEADSPVRVSANNLQRSNPWSALFWKEIRLQRTNLYFALLLIVAWLIVYSATRLATDPHVRESFAISVYFLLRFGFFFFLPLAVGATAVASEREIGVVGMQLSLPISGRNQWALKVCVCVGLTALFSGLIGTNADRIYFQHHDIWRVGGTEINPANSWFALVAVGATLAGLYASTLARSTLLAFVSGTVIPGVGYCVLILGAIYGFGVPMHPLWAPRLAVAGSVAIAVVVYIFGFWNFTQRWNGGGWICVQLSVWLGAAYTMGWFASELG